MASHRQLDDLLNDALNEFEEETAAGNVDVASATSRAVAASASVHSGVGLGAGTVGTTSDDTMRETVNRMMRDVQDPDFQRALEQTIREMGTGAGASTAGGLSNGGADAAMSADLFRSLATESGAQGAEGIAKTLEILQKLSLEADNMGAGGIPGSGVSSGSAAAAEDLSDEVIQRMMGEFEAMGQKEDFTGVVDNMIRQLLHKDIMYVPMKSICERFPQWLASHAGEQSKEEYENYGRMYQSFQKLVMVYETEPDNFPRLMELMQDLQECGQPPSDIIKDLAPGLELNPDGLPMMPNMGPGMGNPAAGGLPGGGCAVM